MKRRRGDKVEANAFVIMSDIFISLSFILILFLIVVALSSSSALEQIQVNSLQESFAGQVRLAMRQSWDAHRVSESRDGNIQRFSFSDKVLFDEGHWEVKDQAGVLRRFAEVLRRSAPKDKLRMILVEGHTDTTPLHRNLVRRGVRDSWDMSLLRAVEVTKYLKHRGVPASLMGASGRGEWSPRAKNSTVGGRAANRRIEVVLIYKTREQNQPVRRKP